MYPYRLLLRSLGKLFGALAGWLVAGVAGGGIGLVIGLLLDLWVRLTQVVGLVWSGCGLTLAQRLFIGATALLMGAVAKNDGRVSEAEISAARRVLAELPLDARGRKRAITIFNRGKESDAPLRPILLLLRLLGRRYPDELARFLDFQLRVAAADGIPSPSRVELLRWVWRRVGVSEVDLDSRLDALYRGKVNRTVRPTIEHAYRLLGVSRNAPIEQVRTAYRRAISKSHPDRLVGRGGTTAEIDAAGERTRQIRAAYEAICEARGR